MDDSEYPDADADVVAGRPRASSRAPLTHDRVVKAAVAFIDEYGLALLTMRRLGQELGVEAMALYRHVPGRDDLLDAVVDYIIDEVEEDDEVATEPTRGWQDFLQRLAHGVRRAALRHPKAFPLVASRPTEAPWLRPPLRSLEWVETFIAGLVAEGFDDATAVAAYRSFTSFLLGHLLLEVSSLGADIGPLDILDDQEPARGGVTGHPHVARLQSQLSQDTSAAEFEESLEELLNRIAHARNNPEPA